MTKRQICDVRNKPWRKTSRLALAFALAAASALTGVSLGQPAAAEPAPTTGSRVAVTGYDRDQVLEVNGQPFFYNGVQYRIDKNARMFGHDYDDIERLIGEAKNMGYNAISAQILWSDIQPDTTVNVAQSAYVANGANANSNFNGKIQTNYEAGNPSNQSLALVKYEIPADFNLSLDGAKIRIKTSNTQSTAQGLKVYSVDNDWDASTVTWANAGIGFDGTSVTRNGTALQSVSTLPSWDQIRSAYTYDLDVTAAVAQALAQGQRTISFVLQDATAGTTPTTIVAPANDASGSQLFLSSREKYDYTHLDRVVSLTRAAGLKFEIIWFGADSTGITTDDRVPHYAFAQFQESLKANGTPFFAKNTDPRYSPYRYLLDKADENLQAQESLVIRKVFDHLAVTDPDYTVVGIQTTNEPQIVQLNGTDQGVSHSYSQASVARWDREVAEAQAAGTYDATNFGSQFRARLMWEYNNELGKAVKQSNHPVWTRLNHHAFPDAKGTLQYNEQQRAQGGTNLDFIGLDPYRNVTGEVYRLGHAPWYDTSRSSVSMPSFAQGENLVMAMENGGDYPNIGKLIVATLAGGAFNTTYDLCGADGHSILNDSVASQFDGACTTSGTKTASGTNPNDYTAGQVYAQYAYADKVKNLTDINKTLLKVGYDLATKQSDGAGGTKLKFFNPTFDSGNNPIAAGTAITKAIRSIDVTYTVDSSQGTGIAVERAANEMALVNVGGQSTTFQLSGQAANISSVQKGSYDRFATAATENAWEADADQTGVNQSANGSTALVTVPAYSAVRVVTTNDIPAPSNYLYEAEGLVYQGVVNGPFALSDKDDTFFRDGAHGGYWLKFDRVDVGEKYIFTVPVPEGVTKAKIVTGFRGATSSRGTAQLYVNGTAYGTPINQIRSAAGFYEEAPDVVVTLQPGAKNTFLYQATAGTQASLSFDYIKIIPEPKSDQTVTFAELPGKTYGDADFDVTATASSGLPVSYAATGTCTVSGATVHLTGAGDCSIAASQAGDDTYKPAVAVTRTFTIAKSAQTITFAALPNKTVGDSDFAVSASASSGLPVSFAATGACSATGATVHLTGAGQCSITASQPGNENVAAAAEVTQSFTVAPNGPVVTAPNAPTVTTVGTGDKAAKVTWTAPANTGGSAITGYTATASPGGQSCTTTGALFCTITGLTNGKSYTFTVTATNAAGTSAPSAPSAPITLSFPPGGTNTSVAVNAKAQCINGKAQLAVYVLNKESVKVDVRVTTALGEQKITGLAAGTAKYLTFDTTATNLAGGTSTIAAYKFVNGQGYYTTYEAGYTPVSCS